MSGYALIHEDNIFLLSQFQLSLLESTPSLDNGILGLLNAHGVPNGGQNIGGLHSSNGPDQIEYRDIKNNTPNNIGTDGGPHSVWNYFSQAGSDNSYKAEVNRF